MKPSIVIICCLLVISVGVNIYQRLLIDIRDKIYTDKIDSITDSLRACEYQEIRITSGKLQKRIEITKGGDQ